jgi:ketosteroid isomerase-like protein
MSGNRELLARFYARDRSALYDNMHPDFKCHTPGRSQIAGTFIGAAGMQAHVEQMQSLTDRTFRPHHEGSFTADEKWGLVPVHLLAERNGRRLDMPAFGVWRFENGLFIEHWEQPWDMAAFDEFWA